MSEILKNAVLATSDLKEPVRLSGYGVDGDIFLNSSKGINSPSRVTKRSTKYMDKFFEDVLHFIDEQVYNNQCEDDNVSSDFLTSPPWFVQPNYHEYMYILEDITPYIDPDRTKKLMTPIRLLLGSNISDEITLKLNGIECVLETKCNEGVSCVYRHIYPETSMSGPIVLSPVIFRILTIGVNLLAANKNALTELVDVVHGITHYEKSPYLHMSPLGNEKNTTTIAKKCLCCILARQMRNYIDSTTETSLSQDTAGLLRASTFIGVTKYDGDTKDEVDFFAPVINVNGHRHFYLADEWPFQEYSIFMKNGQWEVVRDVTKTPRIPEGIIGLTDDAE